MVMAVTVVTVVGAMVVVIAIIITGDMTRPSPLIKTFLIQHKPVDMEQELSVGFFMVLPGLGVRNKVFCPVDQKGPLQNGQ
jgi:hypothetical protein